MKWSDAKEPVADIGPFRIALQCSKYDNDTYQLHIFSNWRQPFFLGTDKEVAKNIGRRIAIALLEAAIEELKKEEPSQGEPTT